MGWDFNEEYDHAVDELEYQRIKSRFPKLVTKRFECLLGWFPLLEAMFADIRQAIPEGEESLFELRQVKEKFGGLRVYYHWLLDVNPPSAADSEAVRLADIKERISCAVALAEFRADRTCDVCGSRGWHLIKGRGWHLTRCMSHADGGLPSAEASLSNGIFEYDPVADTVHSLPTLTVASALSAKAQQLGEQVEYAVVGNMKGMGDEFDRLHWPGWDDPIPRQLRGTPVMWHEVAALLAYPVAEFAFHPVTAWTESWVLVLRAGFNRNPVVTAFPRDPMTHEQRRIGFV